MTSCKVKNTWECDGDCYNGEGTKRWKDGGIEKGTWKKGELIGQGYQFFGKTSEFAGDSYEGEFLNGYNGLGKYIDISEDATYIGYWKNGKENGKGKLTFGKNAKYPNRYYDGEWLNGKRNGHGVKFWGDAGEYTNNRYEGDWKNDKMDGLGRYDWPNQGTYIGPWENGEQNGKGIYIFSNGDTLKSTWINGYCRKLSVILNGENASSFKALIEEINEPAQKSSQKFIDLTTKELTSFGNDPMYNIDYKSLRSLLDSALLYQSIVLPKLNSLKEYDNKITYKQDFLSFKYALKDVLDEFDIWLNLVLNNGDEEKIEQAYNEVFVRLQKMKEKQKDFEETKTEFIEKYW